MSSGREPTVRRWPRGGGGEIAAKRPTAALYFPTSRSLSVFVLPSVTSSAPFIHLLIPSGRTRPLGRDRKEWRNEGWTVSFSVYSRSRRVAMRRERDRPLTALLAPFPYARRAPYGVSTPYTPSALRAPATRWVNEWGTIVSKWRASERAERRARSSPHAFHLSNSWSTAYDSLPRLSAS